VKVAYVLDRYPVLTQTFVRLEIAELMRQGVDVEVFALRAGDGPTGPEPVTVLRDLPGGKIRHLGAHARAAVRSPARYRRFGRSLRDLRSVRAAILSRRIPAIAELLADRRVDRIHAHFAWSGAALARCLADLTGLPWSMTVHGNDVFSDTRNLDAKLRSADRTVTVCEYNRRHLQQHHGIDPDVVVCGVEVPDPWARSPASVDVVLVGRLVEKKGVDVLVAAARRLPHRTFEVVGDGPLRAELEAGAPDNVRFAGALSHADALGRIAAARLLCLPARIAADGDRDSMPLVVKEAMARGVAVVASDAVGLPEVVDETCGWLVPPDDPVALAKALDAALRDGRRLEEKGRNGRRRVAEQFTLAGEVAKLRRVFEGSLVAGALA
jgi:glycosyltransferase involved in cell wall biosynthesis